MAKAADRKDLIPGYILLEKIGQGGMGAVYKAEQKSMQRTVALKILPKRLAKHTEFRERFFQEARAAGRLNHNNIVSAIDADEGGGYCYIAMEFVDGGAIADHLDEEGSFTERRAVEITLQILDGLCHAWEAGIIHRDVKPENFLCTRDGLVKLCDLGIAKAPADGNLTQDGIAIGTPRYISPEQAEAKTDIDFRADIYSLGASLYHMLAGEPPFDGPSAPIIMLKHITDPLPSLRKRASHVSEATVRVVERMMAKDPNERYSSGKALRSELLSALQGSTDELPVAARRPKSRRQSKKRSTRSATRRMSGIKRRQQKAAGNNMMIVLIVIVLLVLALVLMMRPS